MRFQLFALAFAMAYVGAPAPSACAVELFGNVSVEGAYFTNAPLYHDQAKDSASISAEPEFYHEWSNGASCTFTPFARYDSADNQRTHFDVRELNFLFVGRSWELRAGVGKVFWGATEFVHLVDIINQTDMVENINEEVKLGQPMLNLSMENSLGVLDFFVLPWFRERTFPGEKGRLRASLPIDTGSARYESADKKRHVDFAVRYSNSIGPVDFGVYLFRGTSRAPTLIPGVNETGRMVLHPYYEQTNQAGLDAQVVSGAWLWKLEALYRAGQGNEDFFSTVGGFEYTAFGVTSSGMDLGVIGEYVYDDRGDRATTVYNNDAMLGLRLAMNDSASSVVLGGVIRDVKNSATAAIVEGSRRIGASWKVSLEGWFFFDQSADDITWSLRDDDYMKLTLARYY